MYESLSLLFIEGPKLELPIIYVHTFYHHITDARWKNETKSLGRDFESGKKFIRTSVGCIQGDKKPPEPQTVQKYECGSGVGNIENLFALRNFILTFM